MTHKVRVGPVHAGIIEPGVFHFTCRGERVEKLDVELGFQHRGIQELIVASSSHPRRMICLAEQIAGDTTIGHTTAMANILENNSCDPIILSERRVALELERMAMSASTLAALLGDVAYRLGLVSMQALRTLIVNVLLRWCGSRFGRTLIHPAGSYCRLDGVVMKDLQRMLSTVLPRVQAVRADVFSSPSILSRLDDICVMSSASGIFDGDLTARLDMRFEQIARSGAKILDECRLLSDLSAQDVAHDYPAPDYSIALPGCTTIVSTVDGWRGEIRHTATTDADGVIASYRIEDPSVQLWRALELSMVGGEISDFPVNNKSFNLSYCGVDL